MTLRSLAALAALAAALVLAACDGNPTGPDAGPGGPVALATSQSSSSSLSSSASLQNAGFPSVAFPSLSYTTSGQVSTGSPGYATVSNFALAGGGSSAAGLFPESITMTPTSVSATTSGTRTDYALDPDLRAAWQNLAAEMDRGRNGSLQYATQSRTTANATTAGTDFGSLPLVARLRVLRDRGFSAEPLGNGKYRLRRAGPITIADLAGGLLNMSAPAPQGAKTQARAQAQEYTEVVAVYDGPSNSVDEVDIYVDGQLRSHSTLSSGTISATARVATDAGQTRSATFSAPLSQ